MGPTLRLGLVAGLVGAIGFASATATAAEPDPSRDLVKQGYELYRANKCEEAIPIFQKAVQLDPQPRTLVNLARCEEKLNRFGAALDHYREARRLGSKLTGDLAVQLDAMIADLQKRVPRVKITLEPTAPADTTVKRGDREIPKAMREEGVSLDPGEHASFVVSAEHHAQKTFEVTLTEGETKSIVVAPGAIDPSYVPPPTTAPAPPAGASAPPPKSSPLKTVGIITMAAGAGALALGGVFGVVALGKKADAEDAGCNGRVCPDANAVDLRDGAKSAGSVSTIAFIAGGVLAASGFGLFVIAPTASQDRVGLTMSGRF